MSFPHQALESDLYRRNFPAINSYWWLVSGPLSQNWFACCIFSAEKVAEKLENLLTEDKVGVVFLVFLVFSFHQTANAANGNIYHIDFFITPYSWYFQRSVAGSGASAGKCLQGIRNPLPGSTYCQTRPTRPTNVNQGQPGPTYCQPRPSCLRPGPGDPQCRSSWSKSGLQKPRIIETRWKQTRQIHIRSNCPWG